MINVESGTDQTAGRLEQAIDEHGLAVVLSALADICAAKSEHLLSNWQDDAASKMWTRAAVRIDELAANPKIVAVQS